MIGALLVFFIAIWILTGDIRFKNKKARLKEDAQAGAVTLIKYDGWSVKLIGILTIVSVLAFVVSFVLAEYIVPEAGVFTFAFGCLTVIFLAYWLAGRCYLKRLVKYGYEIPRRSRDHGYILEKVPRKEIVSKKPPYNRRSKIFAIMNLCIWLVMLIWNIRYGYNWKFMGLDMVGFLSVLDLYWLFRANRFRKQMSTEKYKEDVETDPNRKDRISFERAIFEVLFMLLITWAIKQSVANYTEYLYRSQVDANRTLMWQVQGSLTREYEELSLQEEGMKDWESSRQQLLEGVDITDWGVPQDPYQEAVAGALGISDFAELKDDFRAVKGDAVLHARVKDGVLSLSLPNMYIKDAAPIVIESEILLSEKE
ncbi:MAG: hypothetical protein IKL22_13010 [Lachnospiraceae bacterium]|nr:hypothetical protein [Lachnospiraceae bacterium]